MYTPGTAVRHSSIAQGHFESSSARWHSAFTLALLWLLLPRRVELLCACTCVLCCLYELHKELCTGESAGDLLLFMVG